MLEIPGKHIAIVDDEQSIRELLSYALEKEGFVVSSYRDGHDAWEVFCHSLPDLIVLDILMPRVDGLELCRKIRSISEHVPLVFLSSKDEEFDRVLGLEMGADDYLSKPFSMRELIARIRVLFRRIGGGSQSLSVPTVKMGHLSLDSSRHEAYWTGIKIHLTVTEFRLLSALAGKAGVVLSRDELLKAGYPLDDYISDRNIDSHIKRIRKKIAALEAGFDEIETVYGVGYRYREAT